MYFFEIPDESKEPAAYFNLVWIKINNGIIYIKFTATTEIHPYFSRSIDKVIKIPVTLLVFVYILYSAIEGIYIHIHTKVELYQVLDNSTIPILILEETRLISILSKPIKL